MANTPEEWIEGIKTCYEDEKLWTRLSENSRILAQEEFSFDKGQQLFKNMLKSIGLYTHQ